jgi:hypothetical protein
MPTRKISTVKLPADLVQKAKLVAVAREPQMTLIEYLAEIVRPIVERDLAKVARGRMKKKQENKGEWEAILPLKRPPNNKRPEQSGPSRTKSRRRGKTQKR